MFRLVSVCKCIGHTDKQGQGQARVHFHYKYSMWAPSHNANGFLQETTGTNCFKSDTQFICLIEIQVQHIVFFFFCYDC